MLLPPPRYQRKMSRVGEGAEYNSWRRAVCGHFTRTPPPGLHRSAGPPPTISSHARAAISKLLPGTKVSSSLFIGPLNAVLYKKYD